MIFRMASSNPHKFTRLFATIRLVRLSNSLPASALVLLGAKLTGAVLLDHRLWLAMAAMWCITAFGYVSNDLTDLAEDRINKPDRPLPTGALTSQQAAILAGCLFVTALLLSSQLGWLALAVATLVLALLLLYNWRLKGALGLGNLLVAGLAACALLPGAVAVSGWQAAMLIHLLPAIMALALFVLAREMLKALEDLPGDGVVGKRTIALYLGAAQTLRLITFFALLLLGVTWILFREQGYALPAILLMRFGVSVPLLFAVLYLAPAAPPAKVSHALALLKGCYFVGLVALWLA